MNRIYTLILFLIPIFGLSQELNYRTDEVIVRLNFKLLDWSIIDNKEVFTSHIKDILSDEGFSYLEQLPEKSFDFESLSAQKLFPNLTTVDSISIGRQGQEVYVPPFWATFKVGVPQNLPVADSLKVLRFCNDLEDLYPLVLYAHPIFFVETTSPPNDPEFVNQLALHPTNAALDHIMMDSAWTIATGKPWIKVGVFDTGIDSTHEDIELLTGWNYLDPFTSQWGTCYVGDHGHKVAGIIGAKRNNELGIAGIAGGNHIDQASADTTGVSLIDFKRYLDPNTESSIVEIASGIVDAARYTGTYYDWTVMGPNGYYAQNAPGYGIHLGNHSYAYRIEEGGKQEENNGLGISGPGSYESCELCRESFLFSLQNGVVNVVARGNRPQVAVSSPIDEGSTKLYPARYDDSWVISVSSSGTDGNRLIGGVNATDDYFGYYGGDVDLIAPGTQDIVHTTHSQQAPGSTQDYGSFNGTSAAAPHVSGVAALLLSYYNKNCYSNVNLDPADVEYILQKSATWTQENINVGGYSGGSGHGRLNAFEALKMIELPKYQIVHPDTLTVSQQLIQQDTIDLRLGAPLSLYGPLGSQFPLTQNTDYRVVRHKYQLQYNFGQYMQPSTTLLDAWVRHSQTNSLRLHVDTSWTIDTVPAGGGGYNYPVVMIIDTFGVEPMCQIDSIINDSIITLSGYYYHFIEAYDFPLNSAGSPSFVTSTPQNFWYPINPNITTPKMAFSIYIQDSLLTSQYDFPCYAFNNLIDSFANVNQQEHPLSFELFPNPGTNKLSIRIPDHSTGNIMVRDVAGRLIHEMQCSDNTLYFINTESFTNGIYFVTYESEGVTASQKWIKQ